LSTDFLGYCEEWHKISKHLVKLPPRIKAVEERAAATDLLRKARDFVEKERSNETKLECPSYFDKNVSDVRDFFRSSLLSLYPTPSLGRESNNSTQTSTGST
jgi:hypothetical protein